MCRAFSRVKPEQRLDNIEDNHLQAKKSITLQGESGSGSQGSVEGGYISFQLNNDQELKEILTNIRSTLEIKNISWKLKQKWKD